MAKFTVHFDIRKGNTSATMYTTVEADSEHMAVRLAETKLKSSSPTHRDWTWNPKKISKS